MTSLDGSSSCSCKRNLLDQPHQFRGNLSGMFSETTQSPDAVDCKHDIPNREKWVAGGAVALALALRLFQLGHKSVWLDEAASVAIARLSWVHFLALLSDHEANMALYYGLLRFWLHLGDSAWLIRLPSVLFGIASVWLLYYLASEMFTPRIALMAAILLAFNAFHVAYSQEARSYAMAGFFSILSMLVWIRALKQPTRAHWDAWILVSTLALYTHLFCGLILLAQLFSLRWWDEKPFPWQRILSSLTAYGVFIFPLAAFVISRDTNQLSWVPSTHWRDLPMAIGSLSGSGSLGPPGSHFPSASVALTLGALAGLALMAYKMYSRTTTTRNRFFLGLAVAWVVVPITLTFAASEIRPMFVTRFLIVCLPGIALSGAYLLGHIPNRWFRAAAMGAWLGFQVIGLIIYYRSKKDNWRASANLVSDRCKPGDAVLVYPPGPWDLPFNFYYTRDCRQRSCAPILFPRRLDAYSIYWSGRGAGIVPLHYAMRQVQKMQRRVWIVVYTRQLGYPPVRAFQDGLMPKWLKWHYRFAHGYSFYGIEVLLFQRR